MIFAIYFKKRSYATRSRKLTADLGLTLRGSERPGLTGTEDLILYLASQRQVGKWHFAGNNDIMNCYCVIHLSINMFCTFSFGLLHAL